MARIPSKSVSSDDLEQLKSLEKNLKLVVFGQDKAVEMVSSAVKLAKAGLREEEKPIGSYLFTGPTGVGKTELAQQLASELGMKLLRFDMSEYMEKHDASKLIGAAPGYVGFEDGGKLTDMVDQNPHSVILLDEIEKAHGEIYNLLLQVMDYGKLTDNNGKEIDFRNCILIMTSNAGAAEISKAPMGFGKMDRDGEDKEAIEKHFTPEFRNRLDSIIPFAHLPQEVVIDVVNKFVFQLESMLANKNVAISLDISAHEWLCEKGYDRANGARPLQRLITENIKKPLADEVLFGKLVKGGSVKVVAKENGEGLGFEFGKAAKPKLLTDKSKEEVAVE